MEGSLIAWAKLLGRTQEDPALKRALAAAGIRKVPKLSKGRARVQFDLKGLGLALKMTDEGYLEDSDQRLGQGPLILSGVIAYLAESVSDELFAGKLPHKLVANMTRQTVRKLLGRPSRSTNKDDPPILDAWVRDGREIIATYSYSKPEMLNMLGLHLPGA
jgi:hypothetical protein